MYRAARTLLVLLGVTSVLLLTAALVGCSASTPDPRTGAPIPGEVALRELTLSAQEASAAIAGMRTARVEGADVANDWISTTGDGGFEATGRLGGNASSWSTSDGRSYSLVALQVPQRSGIFKFEHAVPLVITGDTKFTVEGKPLSREQLDAGGFLEDRWIRAVFSVQDGWIRADELNILEREVDWGPWPDDYPPSAYVDERTLFEDAKRPQAQGEYWLDSRTYGPSAKLAGHTDGAMTSDPPELGLVGSVDLAIPDRLGPAAIYHLVQVFYRDSALLPSEGVGDQTSLEVKATMQGGRLVAVPE